MNTPTLRTIIAALKMAQVVSQACLYLEHNEF